MAIPIKKDDHPFTYKEYKTWPLHERWELIDGVAYDMSPAPSRYHQHISRNLEFQIVTFLQDKPCEVYDAPFDVFLPEGDEDEDEITTIVQPDIVVVCDEHKLTDKGCRGAPDIVVEIISPYTGAKDKKEKFALYEKHGVKAYWIVDPSDGTVMVFMLDSSGSYGKPRVFTKEEKFTTPLLKGLEIDLAKVFD
jgi:Uma2 family endonuclease